MAASVETSLLPEDAIARGHDAYEVLIKAWGTNPADRYPLVGQPGFPFTPAAVALGPRSTVDRVLMSWNVLKTRVADLEVQEPEGMTRVLTFDRPLSFAQPSGRGYLATAGGTSFMRQAIEKGLLYFFPSFGSVMDPGSPDKPNRLMTTILPAHYLKADGTQVNFPDTTDAANLWADAPLLQLQFYRRDGLVPPAGKRFPYQFRYNTAVAGPAVGAAETAIGFFPTFGRKAISIQVSGDVANITFRIAALRGLTNLENAGGQNWIAQETTEGEKIAATANASTRFHLCDPCADYTIIYATSPGGAATVRYTVSAVD